MAPGEIYEVDVNFAWPPSIVVPRGYRLFLTVQRTMRLLVTGAAGSSARFDYEVLKEYMSFEVRGARCHRTNSQMLRTSED